MSENYEIVYSFVCNNEENLGERSFEAHESIFEAIKAGDSKKAVQAMAEHMRQNKENLIGAIKRFYSKKKLHQEGPVGLSTNHH